MLNSIELQTILDWIQKQKKYVFLNSTDKVVLNYLDSELFVCAITAIRARKTLFLGFLVCQVPPNLCLCSCHSAEPDICWIQVRRHCLQSALLFYAITFAIPATGWCMDRSQKQVLLPYGIQTKATDLITAAGCFADKT